MLINEEVKLNKASDETFLKVIENVSKVMNKRLSTYDTMLKLTASNSFIACDFNMLKHLENKMIDVIKLTSIIIETIIKQYQIEHLSLNEIKNNLLAFSNKKEYQFDINQMFKLN